MTITDEMVERAAKIVDPDAWDDDPCDPEICRCGLCVAERLADQEKARRIGRAALEAALSGKEE